MLKFNHSPKEYTVNRIAATALVALALVVAACGGTNGPDGSPTPEISYVDQAALQAAFANDNKELYGVLKIHPNDDAQASLEEQSVDVLPRCYTTFAGTDATPTGSLQLGAPIGGQTCDTYPTTKKAPDGARMVGTDLGEDTLWITSETTNLSPIPNQNVKAIEFIVPVGALEGSVWSRVVITKAAKAGAGSSAVPSTLDGLVGKSIAATLAPVADGKVILDLSGIKVGEAAIVVVQLVWRTADGALRGLVAYPFSYIVTAPITAE